MGVSPFEDQPCVLRGNGTQIKYATMWLRALFNAKPNISQFHLFQQELMYGVACSGFHQTSRSYVNIDVLLRQKRNLLSFYSFFCLLKKNCT